MRRPEKYVVLTAVAANGVGGYWQPCLGPEHRLVGSPTNALIPAMVRAQRIAVDHRRPYLDGDELDEIEYTEIETWSGPTGHPRPL